MSGITAPSRTHLTIARPIRRYVSAYPAAVETHGSKHAVPLLQPLPTENLGFPPDTKGVALAVASGCEPGGRCCCLGD
eukprot:CAMPEP_0181396502 /NCGR_PEP_ID=MMETSP1106-20121128/28904_1 /TAXON_ID=81844 /ORGANISM="Mantoniella antarctica, Strain SL-175" /LENGTH=77 /DNA_ID=CAMNT_0023518187 /DNA_START=161 /DNA_END=391 /DNA_ORIENTATION=+